MYQMQVIWLRDRVQQEQRNIKEANHWREYFPDPEVLQKVPGSHRAQNDEEAQIRASFFK